jgi:SAM-dependent methyltransferase
MKGDPGGSRSGPGLPLVVSDGSVLSGCGPQPEPGPRVPTGKARFSTVALIPRSRPGPDIAFGVTVSRARPLLVRHLIGSGIELGPGHNPMPLPLPGVDVRYVDRWAPEENRRLFPELGHDAPFPQPDIVADFDRDRLRPLGDCSQDFVICSHVLEHLAEPIGFVEEIHRVLRPGGVVLILLPDRHRTFDRDRSPTTLAHLVAEYETGVTEVDDDHIVEFLTMTGSPPSEWRRQRARLFDLHRQRSIHVHCWDDEEFFSVLLHTVDRLGARWEFVDGTVTAEGGPEGEEFGFVLRRSFLDLDGAAFRDRLDATWRTWRSARLAELNDSTLEPAM